MVVVQKRTGGPDRLGEKYHRSQNAKVLPE